MRSALDRERTERGVRAALTQVHLEALADSFDPHGFFVYCLWGVALDRPLYVGCSSNVLSRLGSHLSDRGKRDLVRRVTITRCATRVVMMRTERRLIAELQPTLNIVGVSPRVRQ